MGSLLAVSWAFPRDGAPYEPAPDRPIALESTHGKPGWSDREEEILEHMLNKDEVLAVVHRLLRSIAEWSPKK
jgi:hypothetical protein